MKDKKFAFLFPGQGSQYVGMGKEFYESFKEAKNVFDEADDRLKRNISKLMFSGDEKILTETKNSQLAIYVMSLAVLSVIEKKFTLHPSVASGLSLGEYTALTATRILPFQEGLDLVNKRAEYMNEACLEKPGTMAVILGFSEEEVKEVLSSLLVSEEIWIANYNCPGQIVISGTEKGVQKASEKAKEKGAKRVLSLAVHGAFHSGLMTSAEKKLRPHIQKTVFYPSSIAIVMNVPGNYVTEEKLMKECLEKQVTHSVKWQQGIMAMEENQIDLYIEMGCGKTLAGLNKKIKTLVPTVSIEKPDDLFLLEKTLKEQM